MNAVMQTMQGFNSVRVVTLVIVAVILMVGFSFISIRLASPVLAPLYSNLSSDDAGGIVSELGAMGIDFELGSSGSEILVASPDILQVRMALAQKGLPSHGSIVGYEIFDKDTALGTSNFVLNVNLIRALEGELGRTISSMSSIKAARVHLVIPKKDVFRNSRVEPSASVVLTLNNRNLIPKEEALAVKHLVTSAVPGLKPSHVTIIDSVGKLLTRGASQEDNALGGNMGASDSEDYRTQYENKLERTVVSLLERTVGMGRVTAKISTDMSFDRVTISSEEYNPDGQVVRSSQLSENRSNSFTGDSGGAVSAASNLPGGGASGNGHGANDEQVNEVTNYEISKTITNRVSDVGTVKRITIAVLVDGRYEEQEDDEGEVTNVYIPRSEEELEKLRGLVSSAIGFDESRGDTINVTNMQFERDTTGLMESDDPLGWIKQDLDSILKTVMVGVVAILAILLVIRPLVNRAFEISEHEESGESFPSEGNDDMAFAGGTNAPSNTWAEPGTDNADFDMIQSKVNNTPARRINELIENNPDEALSVIRSWLADNN